MPQISSYCDFPNLRIPSDDFVCKRIEATIEGESGVFYGIVRKSSGLPDGYGVFRVGEWIDCGKFKDGHYREGIMVSFNSVARVLKLTHKKLLGGGSFLKKIEIFSPLGVEKDFYKDGQKTAKIPRLNR